MYLSIYKHLFRNLGKKKVQHRKNIGNPGPNFVYHIYIVYHIYFVYKYKLLIFKLTYHWVFPICTNVKSSE